MQQEGNQTVGKINEREKYVRGQKRKGKIEEKKEPQSKYLSFYKMKLKRINHK